MVVRTMRAFTVGALLGTIAVVGCASAFHRTEIDPPAQASIESPASPYLQVREIGVSHKVVLFHFYGLSQFAVTVDVRNRSSAPLTLDAAGATLDLEHMCDPKRARAAAVASGLGELPERLDLKATTPGPLTIGPAEDRTFWIVFERVDLVSGCERVSLTLLSTKGEPFLVHVLDPSMASSMSSARRPGAFGLTIGLADQDFGAGAELVNVRESVWYARGAIKGGLTFEAGRLFERSPVGLQQASTISAGFSLSWRPPLVTGGIFAAGHATYATFENPAILGDRGWPDLSVGLEVPVQPGQLPAPFTRLGYTRVFDDRTPYRNALLFSIDARYASW
jgi:hypothetical protein